MKSHVELHGFIGLEDLSSVWCEHYLFSAVAEEYFQSKADLYFLGEVGKVATARYMQVQAAQFICISRDMEVQALEEASTRIVLKEKEIELLRKENGELKDKVSKLSNYKKDLEGRVVVLCEEKKEAEESKKQHDFQMSHLTGWIP
ncbi:hypothetical protein PIB30_059023 [Stylosanthes scabra]|uniref:Uncharacterized protein n=1 Tax=Stylosanthes scabra TaxID=79078 RepID=A0ABU6SLY5_9FABA|nr:hypothetical protein [Stylosanthes scabra]